MAMSTAKQTAIPTAMSRPMPLATTIPMATLTAKLMAMPMAMLTAMLLFAERFFASHTLNQYQIIMCLEKIKNPIRFNIVFDVEGSTTCKPMMNADLIRFLIQLLKPKQPLFCCNWQSISRQKQILQWWISD